MIRVRKGFTLIELIVVLVILSATLAVVTPALGILGSSPTRSADRVLATLLQARAGAQDEGTAIELTIAPDDGRIWWRHSTADSTGRLLLDADTDLDANTTRCTFRFVPVGLSWGDSLIVHEHGRSSVLFLDPQSGSPRRMDLEATAPRAEP